MSRPAFDPTPEQRKMVEAMVGFGIPQPHICRVVGISEKTLRKHFEAEIETGASIANAKVAEFLFKQATGRNGATGPATTAAIFWMKTRAGWRETVQIAGHDGGPLAPTPEQQAALEAERVREALAIMDAAFGEVTGE